MVPRNHPVAELWIVRNLEQERNIGRVAEKDLVVHRKRVVAANEVLVIVDRIRSCVSIVHSRKRIAERILSRRNIAQKRLGRRRDALGWNNISRKKCGTIRIRSGVDDQHRRQSGAGSAPAIEQLTEIAGAELARRYQACADSARLAASAALIIEHEESLVLPVIDLGNIDWPSQNGAKLILAQIGLGRPRGAGLIEIVLKVAFGVELIIP